MSRTNHAALILFAATVAATAAGCQHTKHHQSPLSKEACPSESFPSGYQAPPQPESYFPGPLRLKEQAPPATAPKESEQLPSIEETPKPLKLPLSPPKLQAPPAKGSQPKSDESVEEDPTAFDSPRRSWTTTRRSVHGRNPVQPVTLLKVEPQPGANDLLPLIEEEPLQGEPILQAPPKLSQPAPIQTLPRLPPSAPAQGSDPYCGVAHPALEFPSGSAKPSDSTGRAGMRERLSLPGFKKAATVPAPNDTIDR